MTHGSQSAASAVADALRLFLPAFGVRGRSGDDERLFGSFSPQVADGAGFSEAGDSQPLFASGAAVESGLAAGGLYRQRLEERLQAVAREDAARAPERAYAAAGRRAQTFGAAQAKDAVGASSDVAAGVSSDVAAGVSSNAAAGASSDAAVNMESESGGEGGPGAASRGGLSKAEKQQVEEMKERDQEVRRHEQAHMSAAAGLAVGGASYELERGPDGRMYAVGGEVQIDTSEGKTPEESIAKARRIKAAATAPSEPSGQDARVAAEASQMEIEARQEQARGQGGGKGMDGASPAAGASAGRAGSDGSEERAVSALSAVSAVSGRALSGLPENPLLAGAEDKPRSFEVPGAGRGAVEKSAEAKKAETLQTRFEPQAERLAARAASMYARASGVTAPALWGYALSRSV